MESASARPVIVDRKKKRMINRFPPVSQHRSRRDRGWSAVRAVLEDVRKQGVSIGKAIVRLVRKRVE